MERIGIRELRQHASKYLDLVEHGKTIEVTNRGRLIARIVPATEELTGIARLEAEGKITRAEGRLEDLGPPLPPSPGVPLPSAILEELRRDER